MFRPILLAAGALLVPAAASAQCADRDAVVETLESTYGEVFDGGGMRSSDEIFEVWVSEESGTWTILMTRADGTACVMASGTEWRGGFSGRELPAGVPG